MKELVKRGYAETDGLNIKLTQKGFGYINSAESTAKIGSNKI